ncbi:PH domain-containing protein [uncultured Dietzia sp.]|uniref:PH domain-containing protein n=1 Tax=uncultured Dietzia sp. TaxID=395519 RepID=UPI0025FBC138|nr:PH domain-containing protein [uncultured Dietzia sp.]
MTSPPLALRPPSNRVDPRCRSWWTTQVVLAVVGLLIALLVVPLFLGPLLLLVPAVWLVIGVAAIVVVPRVRWSIHRWEETDTAIYSRSGLFWEEWRAAPLSRVQTVDKTRGPLERLFGLATVVVTTASSKGAVRIRSLDAQVAEEMARRLTVTAEGDQRDAT